MTLLSIENLIAALNVLNDFFITKPDYEKLKVSLLQGQLRKKISLFASSNTIYRNKISSIFVESDSVFQVSNLSQHERNIFWLASRKLFGMLNIYLYVYNYILEIIQIIKGRR